MSRTRVSLSTGEAGLDINTETNIGQKILRGLYLRKGDVRVFCSCCERNELELSIAFRRSSKKFELRKFPGQSPKLHQPNCFFSKSALNINHIKSPKSYYIDLPDNDGRPLIPDNKSAKSLINHLWESVESELSLVDGKIYSDFVFNLLKDVANGVVINKTAKLIDELLVIGNRPGAINDFSLSLGTKRIVIGDVQKAKLVNDSKLVIGIKGIGFEDSFWANEPVVNLIPDRELKAIENLSESSNRVMALMVVSRTRNPKAHVIHAIGTITLEKESYSRI
ncbi:MAG: hypothetical protein JXK16_06245 [Thiotrichales bacterium]|nr:hypothetical protein [Thiotrichales bacterium]